MLYLAIICIACAVSAPCEGIAILGGKNAKTSALCQSDEGNRTDPSSNRSYRGGFNGTSDCSDETPANRTEFPFGQFVPKDQCNVSRVGSSRRSFVKTTGSELDGGFRRRNLLWFDNFKRNRDKQVKPGRLATCRTKEKLRSESSRLSWEEKRKLMELTRIKNKMSYNRDSGGLDFSDGISGELAGRWIRARGTSPLSRPRYDLYLGMGPRRNRNGRQVRGKLRFRRPDRSARSGNAGRLSDGRDSARLTRQRTRMQPEKVVENQLESSDFDASSAARSDRNRPGGFSSNSMRFGDLASFPPLTRRKRKEEMFGYEDYEDCPDTEYGDWAFLNELTASADEDGGKSKAVDVDETTEKAINATQGPSTAEASQTTQTYRKKDKSSDCTETEKTSEEDSEKMAERSGGFSEGSVEGAIETAVERPLPVGEDYDDFETTYRPIGALTSKFRKYHLMTDFNLSPYRYLKIRHGLRNYLTKSDVWPQLMADIMPERRKRCGGGGCTSCSMPHKCWRSAPLLCIPYIRKGQDELLKYLIKNLQKMLGKPFPQKVDIFEKTKYKPNQKKPFEQGGEEDIMPENDEPQNPCQPGQETCQPAPPAPPPPPCQPCPVCTPCTPCPPNPCPSCPSCPTCDPCLPATTVRPCPTPCPVAPGCPAPCKPPLPAPCPPNSCIRKDLGILEPDSVSGDKFQKNLPCALKPTSNPLHRQQPLYQFPGMIPAMQLQPGDRSTALVDQVLAATAPFHVPTGRPAFRATAAGPAAFHTPAIVGQNPCPWCFKKSPTHVAEYFSFGPLPYDRDPPETATLAYVFSQTFSNIQPDLDTSKEDSKFANADQNLVQCPKCSKDSDASGTSGGKPGDNLPLSGSVDYRFSEKFDIKSPQSEKSKTKSKNHFRRRTPMYSRVGHFRRGLHSRRHKNKIRYNFPYTFDFFPMYDYEVLDKDPLDKSKLSNAYPMPWLFDKDYKRKVKKGFVEGSKRKKRSIDYSWPPAFDNYNEYPDYSSYNEAYLEKSETDKSRTDKRGWRSADRKLRKSPTTPPVFALFSELAESMTSTEATTQTTATPCEDSPDMLAKVEPEDSLASLSYPGVKPKTSTAWNQKIVKSESQIQKSVPDVPTPLLTTAKSVDVHPTTTPVSFSVVPDRYEDVPDNTKNFDGDDESYSPTTLKAASIAKGQKKLLIKPSPKVYAKVYPDSIPSEIIGNEFFGEGITTTTSPTPFATDKTTAQPSSGTSDIRLQLLAICEGYLEALKLLRSQNSGVGDELDPGLGRFCENVISQSFNLPYQPKLRNLPALMTTSRPPTRDKVQYATATTSNYNGSAYNDQKLQRPDVGDRPRGFAPVAGKPTESPNTTDGSESTQLTVNDTKLPALPENGSDRPSPSGLPSKPKNEKQATTADGALLTNGMSPEQAELVQLLGNRKSNLLSWLVSSKENVEAMNPSKKREALDPKCNKEPVKSVNQLVSGTIAPKGDEKTFETHGLEYANDSVFPVYAKNYGYDSGGELREVEVLWRKINGKTHEKEIFKNLSVLALLLTSTTAPPPEQDDGRFVVSGNAVGDKDLNVDDLTDIKGLLQSIDWEYSTPTYGYLTVEAPEVAVTETTTTTAENPCNDSNDIYTYISKPDPSSIVGAMSNASHFGQGMYRKWHIKDIKELMGEYGVEFLNYAVFIVPVTFVLLFLFCCSCCFFTLWRNKRFHRRRKWRKLYNESSEMSSSDSPRSRRRCETKRDKDECKKAQKNRKKLPKVHQKHKPESRESGKKLSFFSFLRRKRDDEGTNASSLPYEAVEVLSDNKQCDDSDYHEDRDRRYREGQSEETDRREIIALLDELRKIEIEHMEDKKGQKPVLIQYVTQEPDKHLVLKAGDVPSSPKTTDIPSRDQVALPPKYFRICDKHLSLKDSEAVAAVTSPSAAYGKREASDNPEELEELLPCDCSHLYRKSNLPGQPGDVQTKKPSQCDRLLKAFRDSSQNTSYFEKELDLFKSGRENFLFSKYRSVSTNTSDELLLGGGQGNPGTEYEADEKVYNSTYLPYPGPQNRSTVAVKDREMSEYQPTDRKNSRLKDGGVLCRL